MGKLAPPHRFAHLFCRKDVDALMAQVQAHGSALKRTLTAWDLTLLGVGAIIGAGVFTTIGTAAAGDALRPGAGPSLMLSFVITAAVCGISALCYAELAAMVPLSGSAYTYTYASMGEWVAWVIGWDLMLEYAISNVAVAVSWANYARVFLAGIGLHVPLWLCTDYRTAQLVPGLIGAAPRLFGVPVVLNLLAFSVTAMLTVLLVWGVRESARFNAAMVAVKVAVLALFVGAIMALVPSEEIATNWTPFFPQGVQGTLAGAAIVFFAFIGFDTVSTVAEETRDPGRALPRGILASLAICTFLYVVVAGAFCGVLPFWRMQAEIVAVQGEPLTLALSGLEGRGGGAWLTTTIALGAVVAQTVTLLVYQMGQPRIFFSMARDGLLPPVFARIHPKYKTPHVTTIATGMGVATASCFFTIEELIDLTNIGTLFAFMLVCIGIPILRRTDPERRRPFRVPGGPYVLPLAGAASCLFLMSHLPSTSWWRFIAWLAAGLAIYALYGLHHSHLGRAMGRAPQLTARACICGLALLVMACGLFWMPHTASLSALSGAIGAGDAGARGALALGALGFLALVGCALVPGSGLRLPPAGPPAEGR